MSVNERLARIEQSQISMHDDIKDIKTALVPLVSQVERQGESIAWIKRLGTSLIGLAGAIEALIHKGAVK